MSLRLRLILLPILVVVTGLALLAFLEIGAARERILVETRAGTQVARTLILNALERRRNLPPEQAAAGLAHEIPPVRHVLVAVGPVGVAEPQLASRSETAPRWFASLVAPERAVQRFRIAGQGNKTAGEVVIVANPADELGEIWDDWRELAIVLAVVCLVVSITVAMVVTQGLQPLRGLGDALDRLGEGDFDVSLSPVETPELQRVGRRFNRLVASLNRATEDNRLLIGRLMSLQEAER